MGGNNEGNLNAITSLQECAFVVKLSQGIPFVISTLI